MHKFIEADGFCESYSVDDVDKIQEFFDLHGFVVIRDVLTHKEIDATVDEIWESIEASSARIRAADMENWSYWQRAISYLWNIKPAVQRSNRSTHNDYWPFSSKGIFANVALSEQIFKNRQNALVFKAFEAVIGIRDLLVSIDRFGFINEATEEQKPWLHWDLNPWLATGVATPLHHKIQTPEQRKNVLLERLKKKGNFTWFNTENNAVTSMSPHPVQGFIALSHNKVGEGGFMCIPGFHKEIKDWAQNNPKTTEVAFLNVPEGDEHFETSKIVKVPVRKGNLLIWSSALPHCNYAGSKPRICQYIKMFPSALYSDPEIASARGELVKTMLPDDFIVSPCGKFVLGLDSLN